VFFAAKTKVKLFTHAKKRWAGKNDRSSCATVKRAASLNLVACIGHGGFGCLRCFPQNLTGAMMARFAKDVIAPSALQAMPHHRCDWVLMHDNDSKCRSKVRQNQVVALGIPDLGQPAQSPDFNPIENVRKELKSALEGRKPLLSKGCCER